MGRIKITSARAVIVSLFLMAALVLGSCSSGASGPSQAPANQTASQVTIAMNTGSEPAAGFDPLVSWGCGEHVHEPLIQSTLVTTTTDMGFANDLATSYASSADGMTWTFDIRSDVKFTDGVPLTAEDVAFTINGIINSPASEADLTMVRSAVAESPTRVVLNMAKPYNALLYTLAVVGIVPAHAYGADYGNHPIGSGRYMLEQWDRGQQVILKANPDYYGGKPSMQRVVIAFMEEDAALAAARSGQVDIAYTSATYSNQNINGYELLSCKTVDSRGISLPSVAAGASKEDKGSAYPAGNMVTSDLAIRQAINYAVDRPAIIDHVLNGHGSPAYSVSDNMPWSSPDMMVATDVSRAKQILDNAGWAAGGDGIRVKQGVRAELPLYYPANDSVRQAIAAEFSNQMKAIGIAVTPKGASWDDIYPHEYESPVLWGWGSNSPTELYELNYSSGWGNFACYDNPTLDAYLDQALSTPKLEDSYQYWQAAQWDGGQGIAPQGAATWVWLVNIDHLYFKKTALNVADQKPHPHGHGWSLVNNVDRWSWS